ncbi:SGNH/GDSL hydrolase family protein [Aeromicrobium sp.]|uniref:SGNH/GDSL hydrolase family protein n=1 Tax=Aeromicrobium sp. TaxID=1871063 RepID=UPI003C520F07
MPSAGAARVAGIAIMLGMVLAPSSAGAADTARPNGTLVVIGDSITSRYNDIAGSPRRGMYSYLAEELGMVPVTFAESGSGFYRRGVDAGCAGTRYASRITKAIASKPTVLLVEGGRNDYRGCTKRVTQTTTENYTRSFLRSLAIAADNSGLRRGDVYVQSPWGSSKAAEGKRIRPMIKKWAQYYRFTFIAGAPMGLADAPDGVHPDESGVQLLLAQVRRYSDLNERF